jgi:hypothetical protein
MTGRQEYDRTKDRQRILGKYMIDAYELNYNISLSLKKSLFTERFRTFFMLNAITHEKVAE